MKEKLVRDKIPALAKNQNIRFRKCASSEEYGRLLEDKILEEYHEYCESHNVEELADIFEVILGICDLRGISVVEFDEILRKKRDARGSFRDRIVMMFETN